MFSKKMILEKTDINSKIENIVTLMENQIDLQSKRELFCLWASYPRNNEHDYAHRNSMDIFLSTGEMIRLSARNLSKIDITKKELLERLEYAASLVSKPTMELSSIKEEDDTSQTVSAVAGAGAGAGAGMPPPDTLDMALVDFGKKPDAAS